MDEILCLSGPVLCECDDWLVVLNHFLTVQCERMGATRSTSGSLLTEGAAHCVAGVTTGSVIGARRCGSQLLVLQRVSCCSSVVFAFAPHLEQRNQAHIDGCV